MRVLDDLRHLWSLFHRGRGSFLRATTRDLPLPISLPSISLLLLQRFFSLCPRLSTRCSLTQLFFPTLPSRGPFPLSLLFILRRSRLLPLLSRRAPISIPLSTSPICLPRRLRFLFRRGALVHRRRAILHLRVPPISRPRDSWLLPSGLSLFCCSFCWSAPIVRHYGVVAFLLHFIARLYVLAWRPGFIG